MTFAKKKVDKSLKPACIAIATHTKQMRIGTNSVVLLRVDDTPAKLIEPHGYRVEIVGNALTKIALA